MLKLILRSLSWSINAAMLSTVACIMFNVDKKKIKKIILVTTIYGFIRGYTGKGILELLFYKTALTK